MSVLQITTPCNTLACYRTFHVTSCNNHFGGMGSTRRSLRSPAFLRSPVFLRSASPFPGRSASAPFARSASPFVRLENAVLGRLSEHQLKEVDVELALPPALEDVGSEADAHSYRPSFSRSTGTSFASPRSTEYCCAICIELLLRPVVLSCGHRTPHRA